MVDVRRSYSKPKLCRFGTQCGVGLDAKKRFLDVSAWANLFARES